jgi:hypothetical protein
VWRAPGPRAAAPVRERAGLCMLGR